MTFANNNHTQSEQQVLSSVSAFVTTTERMFELAKADEWDQIIHMESERRPQLEAFFVSLSPEIRDQYSNQLRHAIEQLIALDKQIVSLGAKSKSDAIKAFQQSQSARQAATAYQQNRKL